MSNVLIIIGYSPLDNTLVKNWPSDGRSFEQYVKSLDSDIEQVEYTTRHDDIGKTIITFKSEAAKTCFLLKWA